MSMRSLVASLCSAECAGRKPGTPEGLAARRVVVEAFRGAGLDAFEQVVPRCNGANVIAKVEGDDPRWIVVGAHFDHLGRTGQRDEIVFWGADDNAAAVAILVEVAGNIAARRPRGRGVIFASFDAEEPPYFLANGMGSQYFVRDPPVPIDTIDMMICMDLVGHAVGDEGMPEGVRDTLFVLGAEKSKGTRESVGSVRTSSKNLEVRMADIDILPPVSDYEPFRQARVPFVFLTAGRWRHYHTPQDTPDRLAWDKMASTATWLEALIRDTCVRPSMAFDDVGCDDAGTLRSLVDLTSLLVSQSPSAAMGQRAASALLAACDAEGRLPAERRAELEMLVSAIEQGLA